MRPYSRLAVALVFCTQVLALGVYWPKWRLGGSEAVISWDVGGYYLYLPAALIYDDLTGTSYRDTLRHYGPSPYLDFYFEHRPGVYVMKYAIGMAVQYAPFFAAAHAFAKTTDAYPADGFSRPYQVALAIEVLLVALVGLVLLRRLLRPYFSDAVVAWTIVAVGLGTNYLEYTTMSGAYTHGNLFVMYAGVALAARRFYGRPGWGPALAIGALVGLATLTRPTELLLALLALAWGLPATRAALETRLALWRAHWPKLLAAAAVGALVIAIQPLYWRLAGGDWVIYSYEEQGFSFLRPHVWRGLASFKAGWLPYTPMGLLMLAGFGPLWRRLPGLAPGLALYLALFMYIAWSWDLWDYGGSLGQRTMVQAYPLLALPLGALFAWALRQNALWRGLVVAGFGASLFVNLYWTHGAHRGGTFHAGQMNRDFYFAQLGRPDADPERLKRLDRTVASPGPLRDSVATPRESFEGMTAGPRCFDHPLSGIGSLCVDGSTERSGTYALPLPPPDARWVRVDFAVDVRHRTPEWWAMAQLAVRFTRAGHTVEAWYLRPERLVEGGRAPVHFHGRLPDPDDYDCVEWQVWKPALGGLLVIDDVVVSYGR